MLTEKEYSDCVKEMQGIWREELKYLENTCVQNAINGDAKSLENSKQAAKKYVLVKNIVDRCINITVKYIQKEENGKS